MSMNLKTLLNEEAEHRKRMEEGAASTNLESLSTHIVDMSKVPQVGASNFSYGYDYHSVATPKQTQPPPQTSSPTSANLPFVSQFPPNQFKNFVPFQNMDNTSRGPMQNWRPQGNATTNGTAPKLLEPQSPVKPTTNTLDPTRTTATPVKQPPKPLQGTAAVLKTIERFKSGEIRNDIAVKSGGNVDLGNPEAPILLTPEVYETQMNSWNTIWKPEQLEKLYPDQIFIRELKYGSELKKSVAEFRRHADSAQPDDEIWYGKDIPIMHTSACTASKKNKNCMGCSSFWKSVQSINEDIKPWGSSDLLRFEPEHSETFLGYVGMHGCYSPYSTEMLACHSVNTLFYADDPNAAAIWGFISPTETYKLIEEDYFGVQHYDGKVFIDPQYIEKKVKILYAVQRVGQTIVVPSMWTHWVVRVGRGLSFSASWNLLRLQHISDARRALELNRAMGIYKPVNISSLIVSAAYQKIDELDCAESTTEKQQICEFLNKILPILKTQVLEELLGENLTLSSLVVLSYDSVIEKFRTSGKNNKNAAQPLNTSELLNARGAPLPSGIDADATEDESDVPLACNQCKYILFNTRRSCVQCKGYDLCEACYIKAAKNHPHKMKKYRKITLKTLMELVDDLCKILTDNDDDRADARQQQSRKRDRRESKPDATPPPSGTDDAYDEEVIDCICGNNKDMGFMISCEKCLAWLHGKCVGISKRNEPECYYCPRCQKKKTPILINTKLEPRDLSPEEKLKEYHLI